DDGDPPAGGVEAALDLARHRPSCSSRGARGRRRTGRGRIPLAACRLLAQSAGPMVAPFWASFLVTLALFAAAAWSGATRRRRAHLVLAPLAIAMLTVTVLLTERLARALRFPEPDLCFHLVCAKTAAFLLLPVVVTGLLTLRDRGPRERGPGWRRLHRACVVTFLVAVVIATGTGVRVFALATVR